MTVVGEVHGAGGWCGAEVVDSNDWRVELSAVHQAELRAAVGAVESAGLGLADFSRQDFPLPTLGPLLHRLVDELMDGRGFVLLQDTPVAGLSERQCEILALGLGRHVGRTVPQGAGKHLQHVRDLGVAPSDSTSYSYQHSGRLGYHADPNDVVALLCIRPAKSGGLSCIVSSVAVHNEVVRTRPDLAEVLYRPWWRDRRSGDGPDSFYESPVYTVDSAGALSTSYGPDYMRSALRSAHVPPFTPAQLEAMELLDHLNNDRRFMLAMDLRAGDMQFLNNHVTLHSRTEYVDHPEPERRRDLVRLWLNTEQDRHAPS
ncbi:TauD/TfdA family dioxygenase [Streptomyces sp. NPDC056192]|uniref:TauD/TfdA family dioxygenase n=1 Tax=Streptomyces sp. NPDC056192 TaxID=3345743 RepID=UPI0035E19A31